MSRTYSKAIGSICVVATALALSVSTPASSKNSRQKKPSVNQTSAKSFRYDSFKFFPNNQGFGQGFGNQQGFGNGKSKNGQFGQNSFRFKKFGNFGGNNQSQVGFPFTDSFGTGGGDIGQSGNNGNSVTINQGPPEPLGLRISGTFFDPRPAANIVRVTDDKKTLGEERAERRRDRLNNGTDNRVFRFYRDNEAYDERFPSVVYLK